MEKSEGTTDCSCGDLQLEVRTKRRRPFKAGAELSAHVNKVVVDLNDESDEQNEILSLAIRIERPCPKAETTAEQ